jgi:hypothetical protein
MNSRLRLFLVIAIIVGGLAAVNPGLEEFSAYVKKQLERSTSTVDQPMRDLLSGISKNALAEAEARGVVRKDYVVCSIFEINNEREKKIHKVLGFGKKIFIPLNESPKWEELKGEF